MADVNREAADPERFDRGQLFLITGLAIGVVFVSLVLLLNAAIYTENLATRGMEADTSAAVEFRSETVAHVGGLVDAENARVYGTESAVETAVDDGIARMDKQVYNRTARHGVVTAVEPTGTATNGRYVAQNDSGWLTADGSAGGAVNWTLASGVDETRQFGVRFNRTELVETNSPGADALRVNVSEDGDPDHFGAIYVYNSTADGNVTVETKGGPGDARSTACELPAERLADNVTLDVTGGELDGVDCGALWPSGVGTHSLSFANGDATTGTYESTIRGGSVNGGTNVDVGEAIYSLDVRVLYDSASLQFETTVRVAPGEPDA
jgi:hypothetical protein